MSRRSIPSGSHGILGYGLLGLAEDSLQMIHEATLEVLWHTGIKTLCSEAKEYYAAVGCTIDDKITLFISLPMWWKMPLFLHRLLCF